MSRINRNLFWLAVQPTPYNYFFYSALKRNFKVKILYSLKYFDQLPFKENYYDQDDYFINDRFLIDFFVLKKSFSKSNIFIFSGWDNPTKLFCISVRLMLGLPYIIWTDSINLKSYEKNNLKNRFKKFILNNAKIVYTTGKLGINNLKQIKVIDDETKIVNLPYFNKIPSNYTLPDQKLNTKEINILVLCRLIDYKGVDIIIDAIKLVNNSLVKLFIGGTGVLERDLKRKAKELEIDNQIIFCGFLEESEIYKLQEKIHIFIHAAKEHEPFGLVVTDNLAMGIPVIATNVTGAAVDRIIDGKNGFIIPPNCPHSMAEKIIYCINNPSILYEMSVNARKTAEEWPVEKGVEIVYSSINKII